MHKAAGGTIHRLNPGPATVRSRSSTEIMLMAFRAPKHAGPWILRVTALCGNKIANLGSFGNCSVCYGGLYEWVDKWLYRRQLTGLACMSQDSTATRATWRN